jgi:hypothetical protein
MECVCIKISPAEAMVCNLQVLMAKYKQKHPFLKTGLNKKRTPFINALFLTRAHTAEGGYIVPED